MTNSNIFKRNILVGSRLTAKYGMHMCRVPSSPLLTVDIVQKNNVMQGCIPTLENASSQMR